MALVMFGTAASGAKQQLVGILLLHAVEHFHVAKRLKSSEIGSCGRSCRRSQSGYQAVHLETGAALVPTRVPKNLNQLPFAKKKNAV